MPKVRIMLKRRTQFSRRKMYWKRLLPQVSVVLLAAFLAVGCKPRIPGKYLSKGKMEDILYDYHLAESMSSIAENYDDTLRVRVYKLSVLQKYGVSEADFDSSMVYYIRHAEHLRDIYDHLSKRLSDEALAVGTSASEVNQYLTLSESGDTANIWKADRSFILTQQPGFNVYSFTMKADSTFQAGDRFILTFDSKFIFQDGMRDGVALMALTFGNDSVASHMTRISVDNQYRIDISDNKRLGVKQLAGYFILNRNLNNDSQTTFKLMHVGNISLVRMHVAEELKEDAGITVNDTLSGKAEGRNDSLGIDSSHVSSSLSSADVRLKRSIKSGISESRSDIQ